MITRTLMAALTATVFALPMAQAQAQPRHDGPRHDGPRPDGPRKPRGASGPGGPTERYKPKPYGQRSPRKQGKY